MEKCSVCKNNIFSFVNNKCPVIDLRKLKNFNIQKDCNVTFGDLNLLRWVVLKSDKTFIDDLNEPLAKLCSIQDKGYWERLVSTDEQRRILFPSDFRGIRFEENNDVPFQMHVKKFKCDFSVAMCHLKTKYKFSLFDFKRYRSNLITNDSFINRHQKSHRDFKVTFPNVIVKLSIEKRELNQKQYIYIFDI